MSIPIFRYFDNPLKNAAFIDLSCEVCGTTSNCLDGEYFDYGEKVKSVCLECLSKGEQTVNIPDFIKEKFIDHLKNDNSKMSKKEIDECTLKCINQLSRTPPVQWIQYNNWPVCCGDYSRFIGEWTQQDFLENSVSSKVGAEYVFSILDELTRSKIDDINVFWNDIGKYTAVFVFECLECKKRIAIAQSY